jgi:hypothetical protein
MATWKRLTQDVHTGSSKIDVNMDNVATIVREEGRNYSRLNFNDAYSIMVKESPDDILALKPLPSN